jgi:uncharacterized protein
VRALALAGAVVVGAAFGYAAQRGAFCLNSGFRNALEGDWTKVKALALAVAIQLLLLPAVFRLGWAQPAVLPLMPLAAIAGGALFGLSMRWAGGCAAGVWYKLGAGDVGALLAVLGMALGATATASGPLAALSAQLQDAMPIPLSWSPPALASIAAGLVLGAALMRTSAGRAGAWSWSRTGLWIGLIAAAAWPASAAAGRHFGLAVVPGTTGLVAAVSGHAFSAWDVLLLVGLVLGGWLAARRSGPVALGAPAAPALLERFAGGLGLGVGASIASGCTVGQGLTGLALLAPASVLVMSAIFGGSALSTVMARRLHRTATAGLVPTSSR